MVLDSTNMMVSLGPEKRGKIKLACQKLLHTKSPKIREVARVIGLLVGAFPGVEHGPLHYRQLELCKIASLKVNAGRFNATMQITREGKQELLWWINQITDPLLLTHIDRGSPRIMIETDASQLVWGAHRQGKATGGRWSEKEALAHINVLELTAAELGLSALCKDIHDCHIKLSMDNTTAVAYVNAMGGTHSKLCNDLAVRIWEWAIKRNIWVTACFLPGTENTIADHNSRHFNDNVEWMLNKEGFNKLETKFGAFDLDLFASRLNNQLEQFASWKPDPEALYVDAFSFCWSDIYMYAFPPFSLIPRVLTLRKLEEDGGQMLLIAPIWTIQARYSQVARLLIDYPIWLKGQTRLLHHHHIQTTHPLQRQGVSRKTENLILGSWKGAPKKQYAPYIKQWHQLCLQRGSDPLPFSQI